MIRKTIRAYNRQGFDVTQTPESCPKISDICHSETTMHNATGYTFRHENKTYLLILNDFNRAFHDYDDETVTFGSVWLDTESDGDIVSSALIGFWQ